MNKTTIKFSLAGLGMVILGVIALYVVRYFNPENQQMREAERIIEELKRQEREDPYGGSTPEETLQLFIEALKKGDVELASRYFAWVYREKLSEQLKKFENEKIINAVISDLEKLKLSKKDDKQAFFEYYIDGIGTIDMVMQKNLTSKKWKIIEL